MISEPQQVPRTKQMWPLAGECGGEPGSFAEGGVKGARS